MKRKWNLGMWLMCGLMALCLAATGCSDDDDKKSTDDGSGEVAPGGGGGGGTAPGGGDAAPGGGDDDDWEDRDTIMFVPPRLLSPANNTFYAPGYSGKVTFRWEPFSAATSYIFTLNSVETPVSGTSITKTPGVGVHSWNVRSVAPAGFRSSPSATWRFTIPHGGGGL